MARVSTAGLARAEVLQALYNASKTQGLGNFIGNGPSRMTQAKAEQVLADRQYWAEPLRYDFDYLYGRVLKVNLSDEAGFDGRLFDRDLGDGAAQRAIDAARADKS